MDKWTADRADRDGWLLEDIGEPVLSDLAGLSLRDLVKAFGGPEVDNGRAGGDNGHRSQHSAVKACRPLYPKREGSLNCHSPHEC